MAQDDDSFGLPDLNYKPLESKPEKTSTPPKEEKKTGSTRIQTAGTPTRITPKKDQPESEKSNTTVILGIIIPIIILVGGYFGYVYLYKKPKEKAAIEAQAKLKKDEDARKAKEEADRIAKQKADEEAAKRRQEEEANAKPAVGATEVLTGSTGRYYVIAASSVDDDLTMDLAKKMSEQGVSTKIIPPFGKWKYYRLTISDHDTFDAAQAAADEAKANYPGGLWVLRY